jgi:hypothetical protein
MEAKDAAPEGKDAGEGKEASAAPPARASRSSSSSSSSSSAPEPQWSRDGCVNTKATRVQQFLSRGAHSAPVSFTGNTEKEELCLEYVENFRRQFRELFPGRRPLLLFPQNECGVRKFVCTTVRPTQLPYKDLYDHRACSKFVADFIRFEPLEHPHLPPTCVASPHSTLAWGVGDCFDVSTVLCSLLIGAGYRAFVVNGHAPRWVTLHDQTRTLCPLLEAEASGQGDAAANSREEKAASEAAASASGHYSFTGRGEPESKFLIEQGKKKEAAAAAEDGKHAEAGDDEPVAAAAEAEGGAPRVHAWVLVRGDKRELDHDLFVEPSTGRCYRTNESPFLSIDSIWNNQNYWVNMQGEKPVDRLSYDLNDTDNWEFVFIDTLSNPGGAAADADAADDFSIDPGSPGGDSGKVADEDDAGHGQQILGVPASWVPKLVVPRADYAQRHHAGGRKTTYYWKSKHEEFAPHINTEGIVSRLTLYADRERTVTREIRESFVDRRDKLERRVRKPLERIVHEFFLPGRHVRSSALRALHALHAYTNSHARGASLSIARSLFFIHHTHLHMHVAPSILYPHKSQITNHTSPHPLCPSLAVFLM